MNEPTATLTFLQSAKLWEAIILFMSNSYEIYKAGLKRPLNGGIETLTRSCAFGCLCTSRDGCSICLRGGMSPTIDKAQELTFLEPTIISRKQETKSENNVPMNY